MNHLPGPRLARIDFSQMLQYVKLNQSLALPPAASEIAGGFHRLWHIVTNDNYLTLFGFSTVLHSSSPKPPGS